MSRAGKAESGLCVSLGDVIAAAYQSSHLLEPRFDEFNSASEKTLALGEMDVGEEVSLKPFRNALGETPLLVAGGFGPDNFERGLEDGSYDMVAFGRFFV